MFIKLSKQQIIDAIRNEPMLRSGSWFQWDFPDVDALCDESEVRLADVVVCGACAVGAVMRAVLDPLGKAVAVDNAASTSMGGRYVRVTPSSVASTEAEALDHIEKDRHMAALSVFFEGTWVKEMGTEGSFDMDTVDVVKQKTIDFVEQYFPSAVVVDINGAEPATDIEVV